MNDIIKYKNILRENMSPIFDRIIVIFSRITGLNYEIAQTIFIICLFYFIGIGLLIKIHRNLYKKKLNTEKECIFEYDNILYQIAQTAYKINNTQEKIININPLKEIFNTKEKNYIKNHQLIIDAIRKLESESKQILLIPETENKISKLRKKFLKKDRFQKILGILISISTGGIYLLFW